MVIQRSALNCELTVNEEVYNNRKHAEYTTCCQHDAFLLIVLSNDLKVHFCEYEFDQIYISK